MAIAEAPRGGVQIIKKDAWMPADLRRDIRNWTPRTDLGATAMKILTGNYNLPYEIRRELFEHVRKAVVCESSLALTVYRVDESLYRVDRGLVSAADLRNWGVRVAHDGLVEYWGVVSRKLVTDNGVALIVDALDNSLADATIKFHGIGTGSSAEGASETALVTELTTEYNPDSTRATGTFSQPSANISRSVATNTVDGAVNLREHGIFSQAATGGGTLLDRSLFSSVNLSSGDSLQSTYSLTITSGG